MADEKAPEVLTKLDTKAEIVCAFIEAGGVITATIEALKAKGIKAGRQRIESLINSDPDAEAWTKKYFDKAYTEACGLRLEGVTSAGIQKTNELTLVLMQKTQVLWFREVCKEKPDGKKLEAFSEFAKWNSISFINLNLVYSRFRDGLHAKPGPLVDQSQHKTDVLNIGEGGKVFDAGTYASLRAHADKLKPVNRIAALVPPEQGGNGATP